MIFIYLYLMLGLTFIDVLISFIIAAKTNCEVIQARVQGMQAPRVFLLMFIEPLLITGLIAYIGLRLHYANKGQNTEEINQSIKKLLP